MVSTALGWPSKDVDAAFRSAGAFQRSALGAELSPEGELLSLLVHCAEGANGEAGPKGEPRSGE